jgi:thymidylate synthase (FAD)
METIDQSYQILTPIVRETIYSLIELAGRTAYKSEDKITVGSAEKFIRSILKRGHESVIEHFNISVKFITDRGVTHEMVRHRLVSYTQESTRYCNYSTKGIRFMYPIDFELENDDLLFLQLVETHYNKKIAQGKTPQQARYFLPNGLKTEIVCTANIREWRHILRLRTSKAAHPQVRALMMSLLKEFQIRLPVLFEDITVED